MFFSPPPLQKKKRSCHFTGFIQLVIKIPSRFFFFFSVVKPVVKKKKITSQLKEVVAICRKLSPTVGVRPRVLFLFKKKKKYYCKSPAHQRCKVMKYTLHTRTYFIRLFSYPYPILGFSFSDYFPRSLPVFFTQVTALYTSFTGKNVLFCLLLC